ncbi:MAG: B12-binding domain-containing radical SAM protein [Candidatus Omnitrophica bacterium]|nr:B12-binding domain-containing radical SAM protein [Candidatus Omnitrophota bacterium]
MKADVLLVVSPMWGTCLPPMGPAYIAAYLEKKGVACDVLDLNILLYDAAPAERKDLWKMENLNAWTREDDFNATFTFLKPQIDIWVKRIIDGGVRFVGFSINGANILFAIKMAEALRLRKPDMCIIFGGPSCNFLHDDTRMPFRFFISVVNGDVLLKDGLVDFFVLGEGEAAFYDIVMATRAGVPVDRAGVVAGGVRDRAAIRMPECLTQLDDIPFPAWEKLPLKKYDVQEELPVLFSRGCINKCAFCNDWRMWGGKFRSRSARNIFDEIKLNYEKHGKKAFRCNDLLFNGNLRVLEELCDLIIASKLPINWTAQGVARTDMKPELFKKLKGAGVTTIVYGVESLSDNVLKKMGKPFVFTDILTVLKRTREAGMNAWINLITGFPGETDEDIELTKQHLELIRDYVEVVSSLNPCNITASTDLELDPGKFGIVFPEGKDRCAAWETSDGKNTFEIRKRRARELFAHLRKLRITTHFMGIYDEESPVAETERLDHTTTKNARFFFSWRRIVTWPLFLLLLAYHLGLAVYLHAVKIWRKTIIFPGS